jgi:acetyl esterase/lipase
MKAGFIMRKIITGVLLFVFCLCASDTAKAGRFYDFFKNRKKQNKIVESNDAYKIEAYNDLINVIKNVRYGDHRQQTMDVYFRRCQEGKAQAFSPVIFMVHGGAWAIGDKSHSSVVENKVDKWVSQGFVFISVNYRMVPDANPLEQADDVAKALAFAQAKEYSWGGDKDKFILMGHSAGAHLVNLIASSKDIVRKNNVSDWLGTVVLDTAAYDVVKVMKNGHLKLYDKAFGDDEKLWEKASPMHQLRSKPFPMLLVKSLQRHDLGSNAEDYADKVNSLGGKAYIMGVDLNHRQINQTLGLESEYTNRVDKFIKDLINEDLH